MINKRISKSVTNATKRALKGAALAGVINIEQPDPEQMDDRGQRPLMVFKNPRSVSTTGTVGSSSAPFKSDQKQLHNATAIQFRKC